mmetsp:Transcript_12312/g.45615  ORF Transcript_12312/g.45615 Transcript_12312/m.45615 type:complete len:291 (-) Transcript_12312:41-913(-)
MKRQHAPCQTLPRGIARDRGQTPDHAHRYDILDDRGEVNRPSGHAERVLRLHMGQAKACHRRLAEVPETTQERRVRFKHRKAQAFPSATEKEEARHGQCSVGERGPLGSFNHRTLRLALLRCVAKQHPTQSEDQQKVRDGEQRLGRAVQPICIGQTDPIDALGHDRRRNGADHEEQEEGVAELGQVGHLVAFVIDEAQEHQVRQQGAREERPSDVICLIREAQEGAGALLKGEERGRLDHGLGEDHPQSCRSASVPNAVQSVGAYFGADQGPSWGGQQAEAQSPGTHRDC